MEVFTLENIKLNKEKNERLHRIVSDAQKHVVEKIKNTDEKVNTGFINTMVADYISDNAHSFLSATTKAISTKAVASVRNSAGNAVFSKPFRFKGDLRRCVLVTVIT